MVYRSAANEDGEPTSRSHNAFKNDGSFLEMFKKMQEKAASSTSTAPSSSSDPGEETSTLKSGDDSTQAKKAYLGKRRGGGRVLPTGKVKKSKVESVAEEPAPNDAWSVYLAEVKRYKETTCEEDEKTRPLVKMPTAIMAAKQEAVPLKTAPFDPRFPNQNQTKYCYQSYLDFHRCQKVKGANYEPCQYFQKVYKSMCPNAWVDKWDSQREEENFPGKI